MKNICFLYLVRIESNQNFHQTSLVIWRSILEFAEKIKSIIAESFDLPYDEVKLDTGPSNLVSWDSFGQMDLVLNVEKEFDIILEFDEIFKIVSTQTLLEVVENKLNESRK